MKTKILIALSFFFYLLISSQNIYAQAELETLLQGKNKLSEIMPVVDQYYKDHPDTNQPEEGEEEFESPLLQWKRWEWYMSSRLGPNGEFVNIPRKLMEGIKEKERMPSEGDRNINSAWSFVGPSTVPYGNNDAGYNGIGRVDRIYFHPTNANIIFIATPAGGLWSTLNGGTSWNNLTDNLPAVGISGFVISYANTSNMYLLTGDGDSNMGSFVQSFGYQRTSIGVLKSTDGGVSWHETPPLTQGPDLYAGYQLVQSPTDPNILLAATSKGIYRTTDGAASWTRVLSLPCFDIEFKPGDGTRVYASVDGDIWISTNSGQGWTSNSTFDVNPANCVGYMNNSNTGRMQIGVTPNIPSLVYLFAGPVPTGGNFCGIWLSTDNGVSFVRQSFTPNVFGYADDGGDWTDQSDYDMAIAVRPTLATTVLVAGCSVWRSTNGGINWSHMTSVHEDSLYAYIHPDVHDLQFNPINGYLYAATDGGFFRSTDVGVTWTDFSPNIKTSQIYHMAGWDGDQNKFLCGMQDNGIKYRKTNSTAFHHIAGGDGFDIVFNPDTGKPIYGTGNAIYYRFTGDGDIDTFFVIFSAGAFFKTVAVHNTNPDTVIVGSAYNYRALDGVTFYSNINSSGSWALTSCPSNSSRFYSAGFISYQSGDGDLYFSGNIGGSWTIKSTTPGFPNASTWDKITDVEVNPTNSSTVWACFGGFNSGVKVVMSTNTGDSWTNMSANLPNVPINCLAIDNNNGVYAGTDIGVFYRSPSMSNWMPWSNKLPNVPVTELVIFDDGTTKKIRAATFGRGVWQSNLAESCDAAVIVTGNLEGIQHYEASTSISSTGFIQGGIGTFVSYKAGSYINLTDGFKVIDDSEFLGFISPCGQGGIPSGQDNTGINRADSSSAIISLRRMWDPVDGLPYGSLEVMNQEHNSAHIKMKLKNAGKVQIVAARPVQEKLATLYSANAKAGVYEFDLDLSNLPREFHYLILFYEGKLVHFQELDLR